MSIHISIKKLNKIFNDKHAIKDISLDVAEREVLAIVGCSGSGKSVLVKLIIGLMKPTSGDIIINNCNTTGLKEKDFNVLMSKMSVLFQGGALFDSLKVWQNVCFELCQRSKLSKVEIKEIALGYLYRVGLGPDVMSLYPAELSGGMQKRVALARALVKKPEIIFFDEPTTGLDPILAGVVDNLIIDCCAQKMTTIVITHNIKSACSMADKIAVLDKGSVIWHGASKDIFRAQNENVQALLKASSM